MKPIAWSYSRLSGFELCNKSYAQVTLYKNFKEPENEAALDGSAQHKALELYVRKGTPLPLRLKRHEPALRMLMAGDEVMAETKLAVNAQLKPCEWYDKACYIRAIADLIVVKGDLAMTCDYKAGRIKEDWDQLKLTASMIMLTFPSIQKVATCYFWLGPGKITAAPKPLLRSEIAGVLSDFAPRLVKYQRAHEKDDFPPTPGWKCRGYCAVTTCGHWEKKR